MRIISGKAKGTKLYTLEGSSTRPTADRAKEALFNIIGIDIFESSFLDLFAGSGAIGLEAGSRGAKEVILSDNSKQAVDIIKKNANKTHLDDVVKIYNLDYKEVLENKIKQKLDYIFIDPPYKSNYIYEALRIIVQKNILSKNGTIIAETDTMEETIKQIENLKIEITDTRKYGRNQFIFIKTKLSK